MPVVRGFAFPDELFYLVEQDVWARPDADGNVTVGLTALGGHISGEFVDFVPKPLGTRVERDRAFAALEMSKTIRSARAPVTGTLVAVNLEVRRNPACLNADPYGAGWLARIAPADWDSDSQLLTSGTAIADAVERYMARNLVNAFGMELPPP